MSSPPDLDRRVRAIEDAVRDVCRRLAALEARTSSDGGTDPAADAVAPGGSDPAGWESVSAASSTRLVSGAGGLTLVGRTFIVLGGAFLLRAITESGSVPQAGGVAMGFAYAVAWFGAADRAAPRSVPSALFHGLTAIVIGLPLIWEAAVRFQALRPAAAAIAMAIVIALGLGVAWHRQLALLGAGAGVGALLALLGLAAATAAPIPFALVALGVTVAVTAVPAAEPLRWLQWPAALTSSLLVAVAIVAALQSSPLVIASQVLLLAGLYAAVGIALGSGRLLSSGASPMPFDLAHTGLALFLGIGGGLMLAARVDADLGWTLSWPVLVLAAASYAVALALGADRPGRQPMLQLLAWQALVLTLLGSGALLDGFALGLGFAILTAVFAWVGARRLEPILLLHGAIYAIASAIVAGLPLLAARAWLTSLDVWPVFPAVLWVTGGATAVGLLGPRLAAGDTGGQLTAVARLGLAAVLVLTLGTWLLVTIGPLAIGSLPAPATLATLRTVVLAGAIIGLALAGRLPRGRALGWLVYPVLAIGALKIVAEDLWRSGPLLLFVALATYGLALIVSARLRSGGSGVRS